MNLLHPATSDSMLEQAFVVADLFLTEWFHLTRSGPVVVQVIPFEAAKRFLIGLGSLKLLRARVKLFHLATTSSILHQFVPFMVANRFPVGSCTFHVQV